MISAEVGKGGHCGQTHISLLLNDFGKCWGYYGGSQQSGFLNPDWLAGASDQFSFSTDS
jgi:hypothetical protein